MVWNSNKTHVCDQLGIVCIEVMAYVEAVNRICHVLCMDCELLWTDPRALRNTTCQTNWPRAVIWRLECLRASSVVRAKPLQFMLFDAERITEYFVVESVKRRAKVQQHKS